MKFSKSKTEFCFVLHYNDHNSYLFVKGKEIFKFKANNKILTFQFSLVSEAYIMGLEE